MIAQTSDRPTALRRLVSLVFPAGLPLPAVDAALIAVRVVLTWIFFYYGSGKLFGTFNGPGIHNTSQFFANTAHLDPGGLFAVLAGMIEFGGAIAIALGFCSRLAALALLGDQVIAMITVTWASGIGSLAGKTGYEFNITLAALALVIVALGSGRLSVEHLVAQRFLRAPPGSPPSRLRRPLPVGGAHAGSNLGRQ